MITNGVIQTIEIKKSVVINTNSSDSRYISMTKHKYNQLVKHLENNKKIVINLFQYSNIEDKLVNKINLYRKINVKKLKKLGVRSYNKKDSSKNIYRVKFFSVKEKI